MESDLYLVNLLFELLAVTLDYFLTYLLGTRLLHEFHHRIVASFLEDDVGEEGDQFVILDL